MTIEELKKLDKRIRQIQDPYGRGFPTFRQTIIEFAAKSGVPIADLAMQYTAWKWKK